MKLNSFLYLILALAIATGMPYGCVDNDFDEPPSAPAGGEDPEIDASLIVSISDVLDQLESGNFVEFTDEQYMQGVINADDASGNFYKILTIQEEGDNPKGIAINVDQTNMNAIYFMGRRVFVNIQGLYIGDENGIPQLGATPSLNNFGELQLSRIPETLVSDIILPGAYNLSITPKEKPITELNDNDINTLVKLSNVELISSEIGTTYALPNADPDPESLNLNLQDCFGNSIIFRNSGYADFAGSLVPTGNGELTGIYSVYNGDTQIFIRDTTDVAFGNNRCDGTTGGGNEELITIGELRAEYAAGATTAPEAFIQGVVISDYTTANVNGLNLFLQDGEDGIVVRFTDDHSYALGQELKVIVTGLELSEFRGLLQVNNVPLTKASDEGTSSLPTPRTATIAEVIANLDDWESTRVLLEGVTISGGTTFSGNLTLTDATGSIDMFTNFNASFANASVPTGMVDIVAIVSQFDDPQVIINSAEDADGDGGNTGGGDATEIAISDLRAQFAAGNETIGDHFIRGVVISDFENGNTTGRNAVVQNGNAGIVVRFGDFHPYTVGTEIEVDLSGMTLSEFRGTLQIDGVDLADATTISGLVAAPTPTVVTVSEILANQEIYESTLVRIENASITGAATYAGTTTVSDGTASIDMFTRNDASFSGSSVPGGTVTLTAVVSEFDAVQVFIRSTADIN